MNVLVKFALMAVVIVGVLYANRSLIVGTPEREINHMYILAMFLWVALVAVEVLMKMVEKRGGRKAAAPEDEPE
jgi:hypothetical protein